MWLASLLRRLANWLDPPVEVAPDQPPNPFMDHVRGLVAAVEDRHIDGEARRHQVYARLIKAYPEARKRDLAFAIERVIQERS